MSKRERRALTILFSLGVAGHLLRAIAAVPGIPPVAARLFDPASDGNPLAHRDSILQQERPLGATERIDPDHASAGELARLPGIGPGLAKRIVADRESRGVFGSMSGFSRVRGIGPALRSRLAPHLSFGGQAVEASVTGPPAPIDLNQATVGDLVGLPGIGPARARAIVAFRDSAGPFRQLDDLKRIRGIPASVVQQLAGRVAVP